MALNRILNHRHSLLEGGAVAVIDRIIEGALAA
jgi:hypothetical protein